MDWIKVTDKVPEKDGIYLTYSKSEGMNFAYWDIYPENPGGRWSSCGETFNTSEITHWTEVPNEPLD